MTQMCFYDDASGLLTPEAFGFMATHLLRHAERTQEFMTLVVFVAERASRDAVGAIDERILHELGRIIRHSVRDTDLLGRTVDGMLSLMLAGIDVERATAVIERVNDHLGHYRMLFELSVGAACCPTHAIRVDELLRHAIARSRRTPRRGNGPPTF